MEGGSPPSIAFTNRASAICGRAGVLLTGFTPRNASGLYGYWSGGSPDLITFIATLNLRIINGMRGGHLAEPFFTFDDAQRNLPPGLEYGA
jgi:hypothetical protein